MMRGLSPCGRHSLHLHKLSWPQCHGKATCGLLLTDTSSAVHSGISTVFSLPLPHGHTQGDFAPREHPAYIVGEWLVVADSKMTQGWLVNRRDSAQGHLQSTFPHWEN